MTGEAAAREFAGRRHGVIIGGAVTAADEDATIAVEDPATEETLAAVPCSGPATVDRAVAAAREGAVAGAFENCGQACIAGSRLLVERATHDELVARVAERAQAIAVGPGWEDGVELGPLVSAAQRRRVLGYVSGAASEGPGWSRGIRLCRGVGTSCGRRWWAM